MKKTVLFLAAIVVAFGLSCCTSSPKNAVMNEVNEFFGQAEKALGEITTASDLVAFMDSFKKEKAEFSEAMDVKYKKDEYGVYKGMSATSMEELMDAIMARATAYNKVEYAKCTEVMEPYIAKVEEAVAMMQQYQTTNGDISDEMIDQYVNAADALESYGSIVPEELAERYYAADSLVAMLLGIITE